MIKGIYETHLPVLNLERSMHFYGAVLNLELGLFEKQRRTAFYWVGKARRSMLGLWETPAHEIQSRHFAFECEVNWILKDSVQFLKDRNLKFWNFLNDGVERPMVFAWMPALSVYFSDPDNHELEFIALLNGKSYPEKGVMPYDEWLKMMESEQ